MEQVDEQSEEAPQEEEKVIEDPDSYGQEGSEEADAVILNETMNPILFTELLPLIGRVPMSKYRPFQVILIIFFL